MEKDSLSNGIGGAASGILGCQNLATTILLLTICPAITILGLLTKEFALAAIVSIGWIVGLILLYQRIKRGHKV